MLHAFELSQVSDNSSSVFNKCFKILSQSLHDFDDEMKFC